MTAVSLTQQQYQQVTDSISGLEARVATLHTHAEAQQEQFRVAEVNSASADPYLPSETNDRGRCLQGIVKVHGKPTPSTTIGPSVRDEYSHERTRDLLDYCSGYRDRSMKSTRTMCLSTEDRRTSAPRTWTGSTWSCTRAAGYQDI